VCYGVHHAGMLQRLSDLASIQVPKSRLRPLRPIRPKPALRHEALSIRMKGKGKYGTSVIDSRTERLSRCAIQKLRLPFGGDGNIPAHAIADQHYFSIGAEDGARGNCAGA